MGKRYLCRYVGKVSRYYGTDKLNNSKMDRLGKYEDESERGGSEGPTVSSTRQVVVSGASNSVTAVPLAFEGRKSDKELTKNVGRKGGQPAPTPRVVDVSTSVSVDGRLPPPHAADQQMIKKPPKYSDGKFGQPSIKSTDGGSSIKSVAKYVTDRRPPTDKGGETQNLNEDEGRSSPLVEINLSSGKRASLKKGGPTAGRLAGNASGGNDGGSGSGGKKKTQQQSMGPKRINPRLPAKTNTSKLGQSKKNGMYEGKCNDASDSLKRSGRNEGGCASFVKGGASVSDRDETPGENVKTSTVGPKYIANATFQESKGRPKRKAASDDDGFGALELLGKRKRRKRKKKKKKSQQIKLLRISIEPVPKHDVPPVKKSDAPADKLCSFEDIEEEEDPLAFYSTTHEGQDPNYVEFHSSRLKNRLEVELAKLDKEKEEDKNKIQTYLSAKWEERHDMLQKQMNKVRADMIAKQTRQRTQLSEKHKRQIEADERKIEEGEKWLISKQQMELQQRMNLPNNSMIEWNTIAAQLQTRHAYQRQQFEEKKVEMKKRSEQELKAQNQILEAHHKKRQVEAEAYIKELADKCHKQQENLGNAIRNAHEERFDKKRKETQADNKCTLALDGESHPQTFGTNIQRTNKREIHEGSISHGAVIRQKWRKSLMNSANIQIAIEIHNEGIIAMTKEGEKRPSESSTFFIPW